MGANHRKLHPHQVARFKAGALPLWPQETRLGVAISGGPDSLALLLLAEAARPGMVAAASVDHGLREESAEECAKVAELCAELGVPHTTLTIDVGRGNLQDEARHARYSALIGWAEGENIPLIATAHHADDQAETLLMRLNRASGLAGLAAIRAQRALDDTDIRLIRPLLGWRKAELEALLSAVGVEPVRDPSNRDERFDRVRMRNALAEAEWLDPLSIAASAKHLGEAQEALEWAAEREWAEQVEERDDGLFYAPQAPRAARLIVLTRMLDELGGKARGAAVAALLDRLECGESGNVAGLLASVEGDGWWLRREPPRRA